MADKPVDPRLWVNIDGKTHPIVQECRGQSILCTPMIAFYFPVGVLPEELSEQLAAELRKGDATEMTVTPQSMEEAEKLEKVLETALAAVREYKARL